MPIKKVAVDQANGALLQLFEGRDEEGNGKQKGNLPQPPCYMETGMTLTLAEISSRFIEIYATNIIGLDS
jgi:hypothetical protein